MVVKRRFSALKWIEISLKKSRESNKKSKKENYDVILQNDIITPLATLFAQTPVVYDYPFNVSWQFTMTTLIITGNAILV